MIDPSEHDDDLAQLMDASPFALNEHELRKALVTTNEFFQAIVNDSGDGIVVLSGDGLICFANPAAGKLLGRSCEDLLGTPFPKPVHAQDVTEIDVRQEDGSMRFAETRMVSIDWQGRPAHLVTLRDITSHKLAELDARKAVRRHDRFLALLSHELRTPLAAISNAAQVMGRHKCAEMPGSPYPMLIEVVERQCQQMTRLLDDLLDVSRIACGKIRLQRRPTDLLNVINDAIESVMPQIDEKGHQFQLELPAEPLIVDGDDVRLIQVIANLLTNAAKYTGAGGCIRLTALSCNDQAVVRVEDDGIGISETMLSAVFEPFVQGVESKLGEAHGLGVGLALVRDLVAMHGGEIDVNSNGVHCGSTFTVRLPLAPEPVTPQRPTRRVRVKPFTAPEQPADSTFAPEDKPHVLLVEDVDDVREMLRMLLEVEGFKVDLAVNGVQAIERIEQLQPDVALVDIGLPELNGYQVAEHVRKIQGNSEIRLIALTGYGQDADIRRALAAGFDHHVTKPVDCEQLVALMSSRASA